MAEAAAPAKSVAKKQVTPVRRITPTQYTFRLIKTYPVNGQGGLSDAFTARNTDYPLTLGMPNSDDIYWPYVNGKPVALDYDFPKDESGQPIDDIEYLPRSIRYVIGATSIFVDEQERDAATYKRDDRGRNRLLDNPANRERLIFHKGYINVEANDRTRWNYLWCMNQCRNQNPKANISGSRAKSINVEYELLDFGYMGEQKVLLGMRKEEAFEIAKTARKEEMIPHAKYLGISFTYSGTSDRKTDEEIKSDYKDYAYNNPEVFLRSFTDPKVKIIYQIRSLVEQGDITFMKTPGQAHWVNTGAFITQLPPDKEPVEFLAEYSITKQGEEFANNLRAFR